jgi:hypothetical protein
MPEHLLGKLVAGIRIVTLEASRNYSIRPYEGDIAVFLAGSNSRDREFSVSPWAQTTSGKTAVVWVPGDHTTAFTLPNINVFAHELRIAFDASLEKHRMCIENTAAAEELEADGAGRSSKEIASTQR